MAEVLSNYVLYNDIPQRHYRQIAAKFDDGVSALYTWEGEVLQTGPFDHENPDADVLFCSSQEEAMDEAAKYREDSLGTGWHDYTPTLP